MEQVNDLIKGLHHITLVTSNEQVNKRFYTEVMGLRRVKLTVNQDDPLHRHLFYADEKGTTGSAITFFEWPELPRGFIGLGSPHHLAYSVPSFDALPKWKSWLEAHGVSVSPPVVRGERISIYLRDPDGVIIELTAPNSESISSKYIEESMRDVPKVDSLTADMKLVRFDHATPVTSDAALTQKFLDKFIGLTRSSLKENPDERESNILEIGSEERSDFLRYLAPQNAKDGMVGRGNIHHIAMAVEEDQDQLKIMRRLNDVGVENSGIVDRFWFKSLYFRDPDGNLLEVATKKPGYTADEKPEQLGSTLVLPAWLEPQRRKIEDALHETDSSNSGSWPPKYPQIKVPPEALSVQT